MKVYKESLEEEGKMVLGCLVEMENATFVLLDEKESIRLGTLAVAMPEFDGKHHVSSVLLGDRNAMEAKLLAERISAATGGIVLVSIHMEPLTGLSSLVPLMKLATRLVEKSRTG
jgi:hypothetical protein